MPRVQGFKPFHRLRAAGHLARDAVFSPITLRKPHILIACMPKSASTFLATTIASLKGFRRYRLIPDYGAREQELCEIRLSRYNRKTYIAQHHLRHSAWTQKLIEQYRLTPVVIVRDLADTAISLRDHFRREPHGQGPTARLLPHHADLPDEQLDEAIVGLAMPWYINFYVGWRLAGEVPIYDYEQYTNNPAGVIGEILEHAGCAMTQEQINASLNSVNKEKVAQFNVGVSGRGSQLSDPAKQALQNMLDIYDDFRDDPLFAKTRQTMMA
ncbi:MAG: sulfotransferase domain-containing protein [Phycisphaeraceae bacterium]|nr:sulfotransferase domain-containing protein [Phycisphaeraceae bacterium]